MEEMKKNKNEMKEHEKGGKEKQQMKDRARTGKFS